MAETVGSLVDKLIISGLKIYHMNEQLTRADADAEHKAAVISKLEILREQKSDLENEVTGLIKNLATGEARLKIYRQFKMYNDPRYRIKNG